MSEAYIEHYTEGTTLFIVLNRPEKYNCFGMLELEAVEQLLMEAETDSEIRTVAFQGKGEKAFSTGANLGEFKALDDQGIADWIRKGHAVFNYLARFPKPTVALLQGYVLGGGLELALACDFRLASDTALLGCPELRHGWLPGWGGMHRLQQMVGDPAARELVFLSDNLGAAEALRLGLVHRVFGSADWEAECDAWLEKLARADPEAFKMAKEAFSNKSQTDASAIEKDVQSTLRLRAS
ncbi:enoyl-CoA hydratase/isomerase family protein [Cyclobacterium xiamenense]|uniref:enoyl-CoA hydratase/isomerase family protein n=1 Tax=Cyclobacterium xiamenense TaxID=1297121 RepID=UPI0012BA03A9|nr:enoyl-CoA hydratase/isomerase family protein [Cyclobacterium xiamenense]